MKVQFFFYQNQTRYQNEKNLRQEEKVFTM